MSLLAFLLTLLAAWVKRDSPKVTDPGHRALTHLGGRSGFDTPVAPGQGA